MALSVTPAAGFEAGGAIFNLYSQGGAPEGTSLAGIFNFFRPNQLLDPWFHPSGGGWQGLVHDPSTAPSQVFRAWDAAGNVLASSAGFTLITAPTVDDGSVTIARDTASRLEWYDGNGALIRTAPIAEAPNMVLQAFGTKHVLVLDTTLIPMQARWYDDSGAPLTAAFDVARTNSGPAFPWFKLLLDGRVAINDGEKWAIIIPDGQAHTDPVPDWLASRPGTRIATIRQGSGYAVMPLLFSGSSTFEILTPDGTSCGHFNTPTPSPPNGEAWKPQSLNVGNDGTLTEVDFAFGGDLDTSIHCVYRWWPALLK